MKSLVGERRALAAALLSFYSFIYLLMSFMAPPDASAMILALAGWYGLGFFGLVAGWFWGRWYAQGVSYMGLVIAIMGVWQEGPEPVLLFFLATHALMALSLAGEHMSLGFDGRNDWRARFHLDELGVNRLGKSVVRASMSLPVLLAWALAPKQPASLAVFAALGLGLGGVWGLLRMRTWGLFALGGSALVVTGAAAAGPGITAGDAAMPPAILVSLFLAAAVVPFAKPMLRSLLPR